MKTQFIKITVLLYMICQSYQSNSMHLHLNFQELVSLSDLIVAVECVEQNSKYTEHHPLTINTFLELRILEVIKHNGIIPIDSNENLRLEFLGGCVDGLCIDSPDRPKLEPGNSYLLFLHWDGDKYMCPIVGGVQGVFKLMKSKSDELYVMNYASHGIKSISNFEFDFTDSPISYIVGNTGHQRYVANPFLNQDAPIMVKGISCTQTNKDSEPQNILSLKDFSESIQLCAFNLDHFNRFQSNGENPGRLDIEREGAFLIEYKERVTQRGGGGQLGACGYHDLMFNMEQHPSNWPSYDILENARVYWDKFVNIYTFVESDNSWGSENGENEFCGWPSNSDMADQFGFYWPPTAIAICYSTFEEGCGEIYESDICFNPAYSWHTETNESCQENTIVFLPVAMHEMGHSWGMQLDIYDETYDYDQPTVMHSYHWNIYENGAAIHYPDAYLLRAIYEDQQDPTNIQDVGVESYYSNNGLNNSTVSTTSLSPSEIFTISNVTVENMSLNTVDNVYIRFILTDDVSVFNTTDDNFLLGEWYWESWSGEGQSVYNYTMQVPFDLPSSTYYLVAYMKIDVDELDGHSTNNATFFNCGEQYTIVGIYEEDERISNISVFPSPFTDRIHITYDRFSEIQDISILNSLGQLVMTIKAPFATFQQEIDLSRMVSGHYLIRLIDNQGRIGTRSIIKE